MWKNLKKIRLEVEVARQMTLIEFQLFSLIKRAEFLNSNWTKKDNEKLAPNLLAMISHGNHITSLITTEILKYPTSKLRAV